MEFIYIEFAKLPIIQFAHVYENDVPSKWYIPQYDKMIEITFIEKGELHLRNLDTGKKHLFREGNLYVTPHRNDFVETMGEYHRHITCSIVVDKVCTNLEASDILKLSAKVPDMDKIVAILPNIFPYEESEHISNNIKKITEIVHSGDTFRNVKASALIMDILANSTTCAYEMAQKEISGVRHYNYTFYCQQAMQYIATHIDEEIDVVDIADSMNVSYGHLSRLFKNQTGQTLVDYINKEKVKKMEELLWAKKTSISEVAQNVGITDDKYASRLFKKYTGLTIGAYMKLYRKELSDADVEASREKVMNSISAKESSDLEEDD